VEQTDTARRADTAPQRDRHRSEAEDRPDDASADEGRRDNRGDEDDRPAQVGGSDEQLQGAGGGDNSERAYLQLTLFPTEEEQIKSIDEAESELPFAFSVPDTDLENLLRTGSNSDDARMRIITEFSKNKGMESNIEFLKGIYRGGYGIKGETDDYSAWYADDGIHINKGTTARYAAASQIISWEETAHKITSMIESGTFATNVEIDEAPAFERKQIAGNLWFIYREISERGKDEGYMSSMAEIRGNSFPSETERLADKLKDTEFREILTDELAALAGAYHNDRGLMRSRYYEPLTLWREVSELNIERTIYSSRMSEVPETRAFITDDEINVNLSGGSSFQGGRSRIYEFFSEEHTMSGCYKVNTDHSLSLDIRKTSFKQGLRNTPALILRINRKVIDLKSPAVMEQHRCTEYKTDHLAVRNIFKTVCLL